MAEGVAAEASSRDVCYDAPMFFRSKGEGLAVGVLCLAFFLEGLFASRVKSPSNDESVHIMAGRSYIATGKIIANPQHPPLLKELAGISLALAGNQWNDPAQASMERLPAGWEWAAGIKFVAESGVSRTLFWARLPILVLSSL